MALKALITKEEHAALSADLKKEYATGENGMFLLDVTAVNGFELDNVAALKSTVSTLRTEKKGLEKVVDGFKLEDGTPIDPAKARDALSSVAKMADWTPAEKVEAKIKAREDALQAKFDKEKADLAKENAGLEAEIIEHFVTNAAIGAITEKKGNVKLLLPHVVKQIRVEKDGTGKRVPVVLDENGNPRLTTRKDSRDNLSIPELVETMRTSSDFAVGFTGTGASGPGVPGTGKGNQQPSRETSSPDNGGGHAPTITNPIELLKQARRSAQ